MSRLRVAAIRFLNPAPLMWDFDHPPLAVPLAGRYDVESMMPAQCAERLANGTADLGLVPITAFARNRGLRIVPGCAIASKGAIRSLLLIVRASTGLDAVGSIASDTSSRATQAYVQVMARHFWKIPATFVEHAPDLDAMLAKCDAALLIGDPALLALEDRAARQQRTGEALLYLDLGAEWHKLTGLPWISALWGVREEAIRSSAEREQLVSDLLASRDAGLAHIDALADEWAMHIDVPRDTIHTYLSQNIHYILDEECLEGLRRFYELAAVCNVLPAMTDLRFL
ncbi:MAG TPA: menaquinone biosynthesis protein [Acidobacteriaceae bacterium]